MQADAQTLVSQEAERVVLGTLLTHGGLELVADVLTADDLSPAWRPIYAAVNSLDMDGQPVNVLTVSDWLKAAGQFDAVGGLPGLVGIAQAGAGTTGNLRHYAGIVKRRTDAGRLIALCEKLIAEASTSSKSGADLLAEAEGQIAGLANDTGANADMLTLKQAMLQAIEQAEAMQDGTYKPICTNLEQVDKKLGGGFYPGELIVVGARPGMGKTAFAFGVALEVAKTRPVAFFSLEMGTAQMGVRGLSSLGRVPMQAIRKGEIDAEEYKQLAAAIAKSEQSKFRLDTKAAVNLAYIRARCQRLKRREGLGLVVVDYLQLMTGEGDNREQKIASLSRGLKALAKDLDCPVMALAQLNRESTKARDGRPNLGQLRESGAIEQDADTVMFIYRDEVVNEDSRDKGLAEIILAKQRQGETGVCMVAYIGPQGRFANASTGGY